MEREIFKTLVASTAHITLEDNNLLEDNIENNLMSADPVSVHNTGYGFAVFVNPDTKEPRLEDEIKEAGFGYSDAFKKLIGMARDAGCRYLLLDRDGPEYEDLEKFDW